MSPDDECPVCGDWRDSPTGDCAGCGYAGDDITDESPADEWRCIDCGIDLEPGTPPICDECVDA